MKTFNVFNRANPPGIVTIVELDFWDIVKLLCGREISSIMVAQSNFVTIRNGRAFDAFNLDAGFGRDPESRGNFTPTTRSYSPGGPPPPSPKKK